MDVSYLFSYIDVITLGICLCVGFALKQAFEWFNNRYIPILMLTLGTVINMMIHIREMNAAVILGGMISGLASTGLYEMLRNLLEKNDPNKK